MIQLEVQNNKNAGDWINVEKGRNGYLVKRLNVALLDLFDKTDQKSFGINAAQSARNY